MRLNEKIGYSSAMIAVISAFGGIITLDIRFVPVTIVAVVIEFVFLSYWGLTTFNDKYEK